MNELEQPGLRHYPLLEGGVAAPLKQMERYLRFGVAGEDKRLLKQVLDLPRCAQFWEA